MFFFFLPYLFASKQKLVTGNQGPPLTCSGSRRIALAADSASWHLAEFTMGGLPHHQSPRAEWCLTRRVGYLQSASSPVGLGRWSLMPGWLCVTHRCVCSSLDILLMTQDVCNNMNWELGWVGFFNLTQVRYNIFLWSGSGGKMIFKKFKCFKQKGSLCTLSPPLAL